MLGHPDIASGVRAGQAPTTPSLRGIEVGVLLQAATALHLDGLLTDAEYQAKRQRLAAQL